jgi:hypothetical protein
MQHQGEVSYAPTIRHDELLRRTEVFALFEAFQKKLLCHYLTNTTSRHADRHAFQVQ